MFESNTAEEAGRNVAMANAIGAVYDFGSFRLDTARRLLTRAGEHLTLPPKTFDLLVLLVESRGRVFAKKELMAALWPDTFVEDANLSFQISALRKVLGGDGVEWIETLPRYGYRFAGEVTEISSGGPLESPVWTAPEPIVTPAVPIVVGDNRKFYYWIPAVLAGLVLLYFSVVHLREAPPEERPVTFQISPPEFVVTIDGDSISVSPNGDRVAFVGLGPDGGRQLFMRQLGSLNAEVVPGTELVNGAFWSPDGRYLAFFSQGALKKLDLQTGSVEVICSTPPATATGTWSRDGIILFANAERPEIYRVQANGGGDAVAVTALDTANRETQHSSPKFLPDGRHFIYFAQSERPDVTGIYIGSLDSKKSQRLTTSDANAVYTRMHGTYYLLFPRDTNLMAQAFDVNKGQLSGTPFVVARRLLVLLSGGRSQAALSVSRNGVLAYRSRVETGPTDLVWFDRSGKRLSTIGEPADYSNLELSPDEKKMVVSVTDPQTRTRDLWLYDFSSGAFSRFTFNPADETNAAWSPDGTRIAFDASQNGIVDIFDKEIAGASEPKLMLHSNENKYVHSWSPDGKLLLYRTGRVSWAAPTTGGGKALGPYQVENPRISPNGKWIAYTSSQSGRSEVYVQSFPPAEGKWQISTMGGTEPMWRSDGKELFFASGDNLFGMPVKTDAAIFEPGVAKPLFTVRLEKAGRRSRYQPASEGKRFLVNVPRESSSAITVSNNWLSRGSN